MPSNRMRNLSTNPNLSKWNQYKSLPSNHHFKYHTQLTTKAPSPSSSEPPINTSKLIMNRQFNSNANNKKNPANTRLSSSQSRFPKQQFQPSSILARNTSHLHQSRNQSPIIPQGFTPTVNINSPINQLVPIYSTEYKPRPQELVEAQRIIGFNATVARIQFQRTKAPGYLTQPPNRRDQCWINRCLNCYQEGHDFPYCSLPLHCTNCGRIDHIHMYCPAVFWIDPQSDPLKPLANANPDAFPINRAHNPQVHLQPEGLHKEIHERDLTRYGRCVVLDSSLVEPQERENLLGMLNRSRQWENKIQLAHWREGKYIISLPMEVDVVAFAEAPPSSITNSGFLLYPWSLKEGSINSPYHFLVWLNFLNLPPFGWRTEHIRRLVNSFGILQLHGPLSYLDSMERLRIVATVSNLEDVPQQIQMHCQEFETTIPIEYVGWIEETFHLSTEPDFTPTPEKYEEARLRYEALRAQKNKNVWNQSGQATGVTHSSYPHENTIVVGKATLQDLLNANDKEQAIKNLLAVLQKGKQSMAGPSNQLDDEDDLDEDMNSPTNGDTRMAS